LAGEGKKNKLQSTYRKERMFFNTKVKILGKYTLVSDAVAPK
jgi:hypothetical protein